MRELPGKWTLRLRRAWRFVPSAAALSLIISLVSLGFSAVTLYSQLRVDRGLLMFVGGFRFEPPVPGNLKTRGLGFAMNATVMNSGERDAMIAGYSFQIVSSQDTGPFNSAGAGPTSPLPVIVKAGSIQPFLLETRDNDLKRLYVTSKTPVGQGNEKLNFKVFLTVEAVDDTGWRHVSRWYVGRVGIRENSSPLVATGEMPKYEFGSRGYLPRTLNLFSSVLETERPPDLLPHTEGPTD